MGISMAAKGSIMGPILFFLLYNIPHVIVRYYMTYLGYSLGETFLKDAYQSGLISILTKCAGIVGMTMVGFMITSTVKMSLALKMTVPGAEPVLIQTYIDQIMARNPRYRYLYQIRPGVTSYATLYNGYTDTLDKMLTRLDLDLYYLRNHSIWFDAKVLGLTFLSIVSGRKF